MHLCHLAPFGTNLYPFWLAPPRLPPPPWRRHGGRDRHGYYTQRDKHSGQMAIVMVITIIIATMMVITIIMAAAY